MAGCCGHGNVNTSDTSCWSFMTGYATTVEPLITDTAGKFQFCPLQGCSFVGGSSRD
jgi:hypothetical protein